MSLGRPFEVSCWATWEELKSRRFSTPRFGPTGVVRGWASPVWWSNKGWGWRKWNPKICWGRISLDAKMYKFWGIFLVFFVFFFWLVIEWALYNCQCMVSSECNTIFENDLYCSMFASGSFATSLPCLRFCAWLLLALPLLGDISIGMMEEVDKQHQPVGDTDISFNLKDGFFEIYCLKYQRLLWMIIQDGFYQNKKPTEFRGIHLAGRFDATKPIDLARIGTNDSSMVGMEGVAVFLRSWNSTWADVFFWDFCCSLHPAFMITSTCSSVFLMKCNDFCRCLLTVSDEFFLKCLEACLQSQLKLFTWR